MRRLTLIHEQKQLLQPALATKPLALTIQIATHMSRNVSVYDSLGTRHDVRMFFFKHDDNEWSVWLLNRPRPAVRTQMRFRCSMTWQHSQLNLLADGTIVVPDNGVGIAYNFDPAKWC